MSQWGGPPGPRGSLRTRISRVAFSCQTRRDRPLTKASAAPPLRHSAGAKVVVYAAASLALNFTETSRETPGSCIVTPYSASAASILRLECVIMMNCV